MLPKQERITRGSEIKEVLGRKQFHFSSPLLYLVAKENKRRCSRLVVVCTKRMGKAVVRNQTRRAVVAAYSRIRRDIAKKVDVAIVPRVAKAGVKAYEDEIRKGLKSLSLC